MNDIKLPAIRVPGRNGLFRHAVLRQEGDALALYLVPAKPGIEPIPFLVFADTTVETLLAGWSHA